MDIVLAYSNLVNQIRESFSVLVPMRISFAGGGTDVNPFMKNFGSEVVSCTISKSVRVEVSFNSCTDIEIVDVSNKKVTSIKALTGDQDLPKTLEAGWLSLLPESSRIGVKVSIKSDAPPGSGLGASSSIAVATCRLVALLQGETPFSDEVARKAYELERFHLGFSGGCQDHYAAAYTGFNYFKFKDYDDAEVYRVDTNKDFIDTFLSNLTLVWTGVARDSATILNDQISQSIKGANIEALKLQKNLVSQFLYALQCESFADLADLLTESWTIKKQFAQSISNNLLDDLFHECIKGGALGGKLLGAGGGGFFLFLSKPENTLVFRDFLSSRGFPYEQVKSSENPLL